MPYLAFYFVNIFSATQPFSHRSSNYKTWTCQRN